MTTAEIVNTFLARLDAGDIDGIGELFAEEIDWYVPRTASPSGRC